MTVRGSAGHYREAKFTAVKHHWWWQFNFVFSQLALTSAAGHQGWVSSALPFSEGLRQEKMSGAGRGGEESRVKQRRGE